MPRFKYFDHQHQETLDKLYSIVESLRKRQKDIRASIKGTDVDSEKNILAGEKSANGLVLRYLDWMRCYLLGYNDKEVREHTGYFVSHYDFTYGPLIRIYSVAGRLLGMYIGNGSEANEDKYIIMSLDKFIPYVLNHISPKKESSSIFSLLDSGEPDSISLEMCKNNILKFIESS